MVLDSWVNGTLCLHYPWKPRNTVFFSPFGPMILLKIQKAFGQVLGFKASGMFSR